MFARVMTVKRNGRTYRYLAIVESYREGGKKKQRQVGTLGNIDRYSPEQIRNLIEKLQGFLSEGPLGTVKDLETHEVREYGVPYVVSILWERLGLSDFISSRLSDRQVAINVDLCTRVMVLNRLMAPRSKLGVSRWAERIYLPDLDGTLPDVHQYYRAMDYLLSVKNELELHLYHRLTDLLSLQLSMVFYDLTSSYFEGGGCPLARYGYSRDRRPDRKQILLGLLVTEEGLPIAHEVYEGSTTDRETLPDAIARLKERFQVKECIFVGDRGVMTRDNLEALQAAGFRYILGYHKRNRLVSDLLLDRYRDLGSYQELGKKGLRYLEVPADVVEADPEFPEQEKGPGVRYILCYNPERAEEDASSREKALGKAERELGLLRDDLSGERKRRGRKLTQKGVMLKVAKILHHGLAKFFEVSYDGKQLTFSRKEEAIAREALRDGMFLIKTDCSLPADQVVTAYKNLFGVERAMREIKDFLKLRPIYHYNADRVRAHVLICVLAYLFEQWFEVLSRRKVAAEVAQAEAIPDPEERKRAVERARASLLTGRTMVEILERIKAVEQVFAGKRVVSVTRPGPEQREALSVLGVAPPPALLLPN